MGVVKHANGLGFDVGGRACFDRGVSGVGQAWAELGRELERELQGADPRAHVRPRITDNGRLAFDIDVASHHRRMAKALAHRHQMRAAGMCEQCGEPVATVQAGVVLTVLCPDCLG